MTLFSAILLGIIQGFTEFLPISSSAHLVLAQNFIPNFTQPGIFFDVILHTGTLFGVTWYFRKKLLTISPKMIGLLLLGTIPAALAGILFEDIFVAMFGDVKSIGWQLIVSGILCFLIDRAVAKRTNIKILDALLIGIAQAVAIIPGISRSGATIYAATKRGIARSEAAEFSFLLSIPAIAGATILQFVKHGAVDSLDYSFYVAGFIASFIFGILSITVLLRLLKTKQFKIFGVYCVILGIIVAII